MISRPFSVFRDTRRFLSGTALLAVAASALALAGCGGSGSTDAARIRSVDAATNALTANILVNGSSAYGDQTDFSASPYLYISTGPSTFAYTSTAPVAADLVPLPTTIQNLMSGNFYTAYLVGRPDVSNQDKSFLHVLVTDDNHTIPSGQAVLRVIDAAPDAGPVDVLVNGALPSSYFGGLAYTISNTAIFSAPYVPISPGTLSVRVNAAGTQNAIVPATSISVSAGKAYTILVTEPVGSTAATATTPAVQATYALQTTTE